ncbi:MAG: hypothetical protein KIT84_17535 [Labilithrix sp.]|nr:hypothetical protein [Labilithrix sp.]MCW5812835.1 hypothetical protein [Labilithrix sp.]
MPHRHLRFVPLFRFVVSGLVAGALVVACSLDWTVTSDSATPPPADAAGDVDDGATMEADTPAPLDADTSAPLVDAAADADANDADADVDTDAATDPSCSAVRPCAAGSYCRYDDRSCGSSEQVGVCVETPKSCLEAGVSLVCGCDGTTYTSSCAAATSGVDVAREGCVPPAGAYTCGYRVCTDAEYCAVTGSEPGATYECRPRASCTLCLCVVLSCLGGTCATEDGHIVTRCP